MVDHTEPARHGCDRSICTDQGHNTAPDLPIRDGVVDAIRARTRAQIESTQIVRPRPPERAAGR